MNKTQKSGYNQFRPTLGDFRRLERENEKLRQQLIGITQLLKTAPHSGVSWVARLFGFGT